MTDPAPRQRTAADIADHAAALLEEAQALPPGFTRRAENHEPATVSEFHDAIALLERLAAQVEDLAAVVAGESSALHPEAAAILCRHDAPADTDLEDDTDWWSGYLNGVNAMLRYTTGKMLPYELALLSEKMGATS